MYTKYTWLATATEAQVRADIIALMCGQTDINALSASCDKPFSKIIANTTTTNWLIHDAAASATSQVLRSLNADGTTYKYVQVTLVSGVLSLKAWENWNATTHVGLNYAVGSATTTDSPSTENTAMAYTTPNSIYIFTTPRYLITSFGVINQGVGTYVFEFNRDSIHLDATYPCHVSYRNGFSSPLGYQAGSPASSGWSICRYKRPDVAVGDYCATTSMAQVITTASPVVASMPTSVGYYSFNAYGNTGGTYGADGQRYYPAVSLNLSAHRYTGVSPDYVVSLGKVLGDIYYMPSPGFSALQLDEMIYNNTTYVLIAVGGGPGGWFIIPKV